MWMSWCQQLKTFFFITLRINVSYYDITLLCSRIHLKCISLCYCAKSWRQNYLESISLWRRLLPLYSWSGSSIRISHTFILFKHVTLIWINHLETWLSLNNMSCYYKWARVFVPGKPIQPSIKFVIKARSSSYNKLQTL